MLNKEQKRLCQLCHASGEGVRWVVSMSVAGLWKNTWYLSMYVCERE
jgi:hypothetical protein